MGRGKPLASGLSVTAIDPGNQRSGLAGLYARASLRVGKPPSVAPSVVVSCVSHCALWLSRIWRKLPAWNPSMSLDPRNVPVAVGAPVSSAPMIELPAVPTSASCSGGTVLTAVSVESCMTWR